MILLYAHFTTNRNRKKARREENSSLLTHLQSDLLRDDGLDGLDHAAIVIAALRAHSVGQMLGTALSACNKTGHCPINQS